MRESDKNKMFNFFREKHDLLLTQDEIDEIITKVQKDNEKHYLSLIYNKIGTYRAINVVILSFLNLILPSKPMTYIVWLFVLYNIIHLIVVSIKQNKNGRKRRMANK